MSCKHLFVNVGCEACAADPTKPRATPHDVIQFQMLELTELRAELASLKEEGPSYPDDVVAVMRDTITAQREAIAAQSRTIEAQGLLITELQTTLGESAQTMALARAIIDADRAMRAEKKEAAT
jgi:regulator of protease activity HflC (stomatin/prohibitin superfamily)